MKQYYSYDDFKKDTNRLIQKIAPFKPEAVITVARGGYTLSHAIAEGLCVRNLQSVRTELYDNDQKRATITMSGRYDLEGLQRVVLIDDIADSGETLAFMVRYLRENYPDITFKTATLFYKKTALIQPDFWVNEAKNWIEFFWEKDFIQ